MRILIHDDKKEKALSFEAFLVDNNDNVICSVLGDSKHDVLEDLKNKIRELREALSFVDTEEYWELEDRIEYVDCFRRKIEK